MTPDKRVQAASEYLASLTGQPVEELPLLVAQREVAELRHQLGQVLAAMQQRVSRRDAARGEAIVQALVDAATYRENEARSECWSCAVSASALCWRHAGDLEQASLYRRTLADIKGES